MTASFPSEVIGVEVTAVDGQARATTVTTPRGTFATPCFMPVGTRGAVRTIDAADLDALGAQVVLGNTYHLMLRPGADVVAKLGGLERFTGWHGHTLTDSGGFQIFSLEPKVDDDGATFRSTYDGSTHRLTPELAVEIQQQLGADIQMVLDVCPALPSSERTIRTAVERSAAWAERAKAAHAPARGDGSTQALFGIIQGGTDAALRRESVDRTLEIGFDGYGIGGLSVGEPRPEMLEALDATTELLPADRVRYLMGVGDPCSIVEAIARGVDVFDCVLPTRLARHGTLLTDAGRLNIKNLRHAEDLDPIDPQCPCSTCARYSRGYLRHLMQVGETTGPRLCTVHNLAWILRLAERAREAIIAGELDQLRGQIGAVWA